MTSEWRRSSLVAALVLAGCSSSPSLPAGWTVDEARAFQLEHDAAIGSPSGPLAAVASHYVEPGQSLVLEVGQGRLQAATTVQAAAGPRLRVEVTDDGARCVEGCGPSPVLVDAPRTVTLDRFSVSLGPQSGTLRVLAHDPKAPALEHYEGVPWFPVDPGFILAARWQPDPSGARVELSTSRGLTKSLTRAGVLEARLGDVPIRLVGYRITEDAPLLVPLTDATTGEETYPVGRYLEVATPVDGVAVLDFNRLTNPWCAYSEHYNCPIPPRENALTVALSAGEKTWGGH